MTEPPVSFSAKSSPARILGKTLKWIVALGLLLLWVCVIFVFTPLREFFSNSRLEGVVKNEVAQLERRVDSRSDAIEQKLDRIEDKLDRLLFLLEPRIPDAMTPAH